MAVKRLSRYELNYQCWSKKMAFNNDGIFLKLFFGKASMTVKWLIGLGMKADSQRRAVLS